jgi:hypothetical protein
MEEERLRRLVGALRAPQDAHGRPDATQNDLVAALVELVADALDRVSAAAKQAVDEVRLDAAPQSTGPDLPAVRRPRFFMGQVLRAEDLQAEQDYFRSRQRLQNRIALGTGVAFGLDVQCSNGATGARVVVAPGCAVDPLGEMVLLNGETRLPVSAQVPVFVCVRYAERPCDPVPVDVEGRLEPTRIEEGARVSIETEWPADGVVLARLVAREGGTIVDPAFRPRRIGRSRRT